MRCVLCRSIPFGRRADTAGGRSRLAISIVGIAAVCEKKLFAEMRTPFAKVGEREREREREEKRENRERKREEEKERQRERERD